MKDICAAVKKLNLPEGEYVVAGSGIMAAKGIRASNDIDLIVTSELFAALKAKGWKEQEWTRKGKKEKSYLEHGNVEAYLEVSTFAGKPKTEDLLREAEIIGGVPFISLERLMEFKRDYGREKDFEDIKLIEEYLKNNH